MADLGKVLQMCLDLLEEDTCPNTKKLATRLTTEVPATMSQFFDCLCTNGIPFVAPSHWSMFDWPSWHNTRMLSSLAIPGVPYHALPLWDEDLLHLLRQHLDENPGGCEGVTAHDVAEVLLNFYDDHYALHCHRKWLCTALRVPRKDREELDSLRSHVHEQFQQIVEDFMVDLQKQNLIQTVASSFPLRILAACALQHGLLRKHAPKAKRTEVRDAPMLRKHLNSMGKLRKSYLPADRCGELSELAADKLPAFFTTLVRFSMRGTFPLIALFVR